jgi:hypothetical protein
VSRRNRKDQQRVTKKHHVRDLPTAAKRRQSQQRRVARLPYKVVVAAYEEYKTPISLRDLTERHWEEWGCDSRRIAERLIRKRFQECGLGVRGRGRLPTPGGATWGRAPTRSVRVKLSERSRRQLEEANARLIAESRAHPEIGPLLTEQERDARIGHRIPSRPWLISLDTTLDEGDRWEREAVVVARRSGDFLPEATWVEPLIARIDDLRERTMVV